MTTRPRQSLLANIALSLGVSLACLLVVEGLSRWGERRAPPATVARYLWDWDAMWGGDFYTIHADACGWPPDEEFNRDGLRDRTHPVEKLEGVWRVAVLGDSVTLGAGIPAGQAFPQALERRLTLAGRRIEVLNVALWGWSTRQERYAYERLARRYRPDQVLLAVCLNDLAELQNNLTRPPVWLTALHGRSALVRRLVGAGRREIAEVEELFVTPESGKVRSAYERFFAEVRLLRAAVERDGASLALVVFPFRFQVRPGGSPPRAQERIVSFCRSEGLRVLDLLPALTAGGEAAFVDYDHLSAYGARLTAQALEGSGWWPEGYSNAADLEAVLGQGAGTTPNVAVLERALASPEIESRRAASWGLAVLSGQEATRGRLLTRALQNDGSSAVRAAAARGLRRLGEAGRETRPSLFAALEDSSENVRYEAAQALAGVRPQGPRDLVALRAAFRGRDPYTRAFAAWSLGRLGSEAAVAVPELTAALLAGDPARAAIERALGEMGEAARQAVPVLTGSLTAGSARQRANAARALGRLGPVAAPAGATLATRLDDENPRVRLEAARALGRIGAPARPARARIVRLLAEDEAAVVRVAAARALAVLGDDPEARVALERARQDADRRVARQAGLALRVLTGETTQAHDAPDVPDEVDAAGE